MIVLLKRSFALIICVFIFLFAFCGCEKNGNKTTTSSAKTEETVSVSTTVAITKADPDKDWVYDAEGYDEIYHIPQFNIENEEIKELNKKIATDLYNEVKDGDRPSITYDFAVKDCLLSVCVRFMANSWEERYCAYNVSLSDGTQVTDARYMAAYLRLTDEEYRIAAATAVTNAYEDRYITFRDSNISAYKNYLYKNQSKEVTDTLTGYINPRGELSFCGEMYAFDGAKRFFTSSSVSKQ